MTAKIKLNAASGGGSVSITAPSSTTGNANVELKLPIADGSSEQVIKTDGSGNLSFGQAVTAKNLVTNGAMNVAQRGVDSTSTGYRTVDGWALNHSVQDNPYQMQVAVASGTTPYSLGFRKAFQIMNGNQTNGATANDILYLRQKIEAQDIATSGWNYTSANSFITLQFWIKSSVAQNFHGHLKTTDGTSQIFPFQTGTLTANTWTKITKVISGNSNLQFDNDNDRGLDVVICAYMGTTYSDSSATFDQWQTSSSGIFAGTDMTTTWFTTNDATLDITGVQLEVGSSPSAFAHETYADTFRKCQRYLYVLDLGSNTNVIQFQMHRLAVGSGAAHQSIRWPELMRAAPSMTKEGTSFSETGYTANFVLGAVLNSTGNLVGDTAVASGQSTWHRVSNTSGATLRYLFSAEL